MANPKAEIWNDEQIYTDIENAVADGSENLRDIANECGIKYETFRARCYPTKKSTPAFIEVSHKITAAIKRGKESRKSNIKAAARRGLKKLLEGFETVDVVTEKKTTGQKTDSSGKIIPDSGTTTLYKRETRKQYAPNATAVIFALCNLDSENYRSIYKAGEQENSDGARHGMIAAWMQEQDERGRSFTKDDFPGISHADGGS